MSPYGVLKIYAKGSSGKTVDVHETVIRLEEPRAIGANTKISVRLKDGHAMVINGGGGVTLDTEVPRNVLRITWDGETLYDAVKLAEKERAARMRGGGSGLRGDGLSG